MHLKNSVQQIVNSAPMLRRNREHIPHSQRMKFAKQRILLVGIHLVDGKKKRLAGARQQPSQFAIGPGNLRSGIDDHNDRRRFFKRDLRLPENFRRNEILVVGNDAARIHNAKLVPQPFDLAIEAVARNAGLVADDGAARSRQMIK